MFKNIWCRCVVSIVNYKNQCNSKGRWEPCKVVSAPIASILPQSTNSNPFRFLSCVMEVGSFYKLLHSIILNHWSLNNRPIEFGSLMMGQYITYRSSNLINASKVLGNLFKLSQWLNHKNLSILRSPVDFGRHCSLSQLIFNLVRHIKSPKESGSLLRVLSRKSRISMLFNAP